MNRVILIGHVGADAELKFSPGGQAICRFRLATTEKWGSGDQRQERTEWHTVVGFGKMAENTHKYILRGGKMAVEGRIQSREWEDKDGGKRTSFEVIAENWELLGDARGGGQQRQQPARQEPARQQPMPDTDPNNGYETGGMDDDIPF